MFVNEIFHSILGESTLAGASAAFVRLTGCNLRCNWCDTQYAWGEGTEMAPDAVVARVRGTGAKRVLITGGEPLCQTETIPLLSNLLDAGLFVLLETNGSLDISGVPPKVMKIVDFKCPGSGQVDANRFANIEHLLPGDNVKFVIGDLTDYEWARGVVDCYRLDARCPVLFSPVWGGITPEELAARIVADRLDARLHLQLHKIVWGPDRRGV